MGNTNDRLPSQSLTLQEFVPPTRQKKSPVLTKMLMRTVRKIEEENYFVTKDASFAPKYVYFDGNVDDAFSQQEKPEFDKTQPLYSLREASLQTEQTSNLKTEHNDSNAKVPRMTPVNGRGQQRSMTKENKAIPSTRSKNSARMDTGGQQGYIKAPKGIDTKSNKFFLSQNKINLTKNTKKPQAKSGQLPLRDRNSNSLVGICQHSKNNSNNIQSLLSPSNIPEDDNDSTTNVGGILDKLPPKKRLLINCELEKKLFSLPQKLQFEIFSFLIDEYVNLTLVSPIWYYKVNEIYESHLLALDNTFIKTYMDILAFKRSYFSIAPYRFSNKLGFRMDRNIVAEVQAPLVGKTVVISFTYELTRKKGVQYKAVYKFDVVKRGNRQIWIHKEESKPFFDEGKSAFVQPIMPVCVQDNIKIALNFYNMNGLVNIKTIEWKAPIIENIPSIPKELQSNFLKGIDKNRICEVEEINDEWVLFKYFENKNRMQYEFDPQLALQETRCSGYDIVTNKTLYVANEPGEVKKALARLGLNIYVVGAKDEVVTEVKRFGLYQDLENFIQLRVGDKLILYLTKGE